MRRWSGGISFNQLSVKINGSDRNFVHNTVYGIKTTFAKLDPVLADGSQRWRSLGAQRQIVKTDNTDISRDPVAQLLTLNHSSVGNLVVAADNGSHSHIQKSGQMLFNTLGYIVRSASIIGISLQPVLFQRMEKRLVAHLHNISTKCAA